MDKFLSGFGISGMLGKIPGTSPAPAAPAPPPQPKPDLKNPLNQMTEVPVPKVQDTQLPNAPAKVSRVGGEVLRK